MIKLKDLVVLENTSEPIELEVPPNSNETKTVGDNTVFLTNLRRDAVTVELKTVNGVVFVTIK
jgi:hypothetical protein